MFVLRFHSTRIVCFVSHMDVAQEGTSVFLLCTLFLPMAPEGWQASLLPLQISRQIVFLVYILCREVLWYILDLIIQSRYLAQSPLLYGIGFSSKSLVKHFWYLDIFLLSFNLVLLYKQFPIFYLMFLYIGTHVWWGHISLVLLIDWT